MSNQVGQPGKHCAYCGQLHSSTDSACPLQRLNEKYEGAPLPRKKPTSEDQKVVDEVEVRARERYDKENRDAIREATQKRLRQEAMDRLNHALAIMKKQEKK